MTTIKDAVCRLLQKALYFVTGLFVAIACILDPEAVRLQLVDLDKIAAGIVEHGNGYRPGLHG